MNKSISLFAFVLFCLSAKTQDAYHQNLQNLLQTDFNLPAGDWLLYDTEDGNLNNAGDYGGTFSTKNIADQPFTKYVEADISRQGGNVWDSGWNLRNRAALAAGDVLLAVFYVRSEGGSGEINFLMENSTTYEKEMYLGIPTSINWRRFYVPVKVGSGYANGGLTIGFHLASQVQTVQIGGFTVLNYKKRTTLDKLPSEVNNQFYGGWEPDAPWRAAAEGRINLHRKAPLRVEVKTTSGNPVENAAVNVKMLRHNFEFGTAVTAARFDGNNNHNVIYENKIIDLDGKGHGFNTVVFENDLKWPAWLDEWFVNKRELVNAVEWLRGNDLKIRGHNLVWPGNNNLPGFIENRINDTDFVKEETFKHIEEIMNYPGLKGEIDEWDVLNEIVTNRSYENVFRGKPGYPTGREIYQEIFAKAHEVDPNVGLWLNDYVTMSLNTSPGSASYDNFKKYAKEIIDSGVEIEGLGFQGHIGGFPNDITKVLGTLDDFYNEFGLKSKITEFDLPPYVSEELAANYLRDFLTAIYSHPSAEGFLFWNFWDGASWLNTGCNFYRQDWRATPAKDTFVDLLFNKWWTEESLSTSTNGRASVNGFKGLYEISYTCDGVEIRDTVNVIELVNHEIVCDNIGTSGVKNIQRKDIKIYPNPSSGSIQIERKDNAPAKVRVFDLSGKMLKEEMVSSELSTIEISKTKGVFLLEISSDEGRFTERVTVE